MGIVFKYQSGFVLPLLLLLSLEPLRTPGADRRRILEPFIRRMLIVGTFAFWLFLIYPSLEANQIPNWVAPTDHMGLPSIERLWSQVSILIATHAWGLPLVLLALGGILLKRDFLRRLAVVGAAFLLWVGGVGLFGAADIRQLIGALAFLMVFLGVGLAAWAEILVRVQLSRAASGGLIAAVVLVLLVPDLSIALADAYNRTLPDRRNDLAQWMDVSVPPGAYIAPIDNQKTFNREWGGYPGFNVFPNEATAALTEQPLDEWRARGVMYAIIPYGDYPLLDPDLLSQLLVLKSYPPSPDYRGPDMVVLRLYPMEHTADGQLGSIRWVGYDLSATEVTPADTLQFTLYWQAEQPTSGDYAVYNHLVDPQTGDVVAQVDGDPLFDLRRPTSTWDDPNETLISRPFALPLSDVPPGTYQLVSGFYRRDTGERLLSPQGEDSLMVATIEVR